MCIWRPPKPEVALSQHIGLVARHIYLRYNATSGDIVDNTIELPDLENMGVAVTASNSVKIS